ncbi:hypothetical protein D7V86_14070 [bacterium D16-51]|nr:hypothetical protein D7V96_11115 [bacterium D16-59]RKI59130.1 hypothetical protein D7V86_14070 [bacterium D16-51]
MSNLCKKYHIVTEMMQPIRDCGIYSSKERVTVDGYKKGKVSKCEKYIFHNSCVARVWQFVSAHTCHKFVMHKKRVQK